MQHKLHLDTRKNLHFAHKVLTDISYFYGNSMVCWNQKNKWGGQTDAAEISADNPTVMSVTDRIWQGMLWAVMCVSRSLPLSL